MEKRYKFRSKLYVKPAKVKFLFKILLNICLIIFLIAGFIKIIFDGIGINSVGTICLAVIIVGAYNANLSNKAHYEISVAELVIHPFQINIIYNQIKMLNGKSVEFEIYTKEITALEYSNQLCCLHIVGCITLKYNDSKEKIRKKSDHFLYLENGMENEILGVIQEVVPVQIKYMDRM